VSRQVVEQRPEQQSELAPQATPLRRQGRSQNPPEQNPEQHWPFDVQLLPVAMHDATTPPSPIGAHLDATQLKLQQSAACPHEAPSPRQGIWHVWLTLTSQTPLQQGALGPHGAPSARHCPGSFWQRPRDMSQP
jgi:hypothetical protein